METCGKPKNMTEQVYSKLRESYGKYSVIQGINVYSQMIKDHACLKEYSLRDKVTDIQNSQMFKRGYVDQEFLIKTSSTKYRYIELCTKVEREAPIEKK
jgi:uncharacterized linocin/CFP29 family protein